MKKVLMLGPARDVKGGMTSVVDNYYEYGLDKKVELKYIETINDKSKISKFISEKRGYKEFKKVIDKFDIVHIHMASRRSTFRKGKYVKIAKNKGKKVIIHLHGAEFKVFINECNFKQRQYVEEILNLADRIIVLSEEWKEYMQKITIQGRGGTDFRPVFELIRKEQEKRELQNLKALIYFTDGDGIYPRQKPDYETAFVFVKKTENMRLVPDWAYKLVIGERIKI